MNQDDTQVWRDAIALFEMLRDLPPDQQAAQLAAAPVAVRERAQKMLAAGDTAGPLDRALRMDIPPQRLGRWEIGELLGQGGMSRVYRARSTTAPVGQVAAVKLLAVPAPGPDLLARFRRETEILVRLQHPGIAPLLDAGVGGDGRPWFAMALVEGEQIDAWCRRGALPTRERVRLVQQVADAVAHAHRLLVVHRDIKPGNVLVDANGRAVLLDFGISRVLEEGAAELTSGGSYPFTPRYAAPEQREGGAISTATDVYGLGALLYKLLLDETPALAADGELAMPAAARLPGDLDAILRKALAKDPRDRYAGAAEFGADLAAWLEVRPVQARRGGAGYRVRRWATRNPLAAALSAALVLSLAVGMASVLWQAERATREAESAELARAAAESERSAANLARENAERERDRAESLNRFILGLFNANLPNKPRDQLPTTAELLDLGVERARDPANGEPALRAQMLTAIANVHHQRGRPEPARDLAAEAVALAREDADSPRILVAALRQQAQVAMQQSAFALAQSALAEAAALQAGIDGEGPRSATAVSLLQDQAMALAMQQHYTDAIALLEPAWPEISEGGALPPETVDRVAGTLALLYSTAYRPADALPLLERRLAAIVDGPRKDSLAHAIALANLAGTLAELGDLAAAEQRVNEAIDLHDRLFDAPSTYRGAARLKRSQVWMRQGRYDEALAEADAATREWALSDGTDPDTDPFEPINRLPVLLRAGRWADLAREAMRGRERLDRDHGPEMLAESRLRAEAWGALAHCALGEVDAALPLLAAARERLATLQGMDPRLIAATDEAEARCLAASGDITRALAKLAEANEQDEAIPPGDRTETARRAALAAQWRAGG
jgi:hypothetical protein